MKRIVLTISLILLVFSAYVSAETIRLADGTIIQGTVVSGSEKGVEIKLVKNNATVNFAWNQLSEKDRLDIRKRFGLEMPDYNLSITVPGDRVETFSGEAYVGKIESEDASRVILNWLNDEGEKVRKPVLRKNIRDIYRNISIPAYILMPKEEVYELILEQHPPMNANDHYLLALYCREIGFYEKGLEHIEDAIDLDPEMEKTSAELKVKLEKLISANEFRDGIENVQYLIKRKKLTSAYIEIINLQNDEKVKEDDDLNSILQEVIIQWELQAAEVVSKEWFSAIKTLATKKARDREVDINGARQYALGQMDKDIQEYIIDVLNKDKDLEFNAQNPSPITAKVIGELFKKRDKKSYTPIKIILNAEAFRIKLSGTSSSNNNNNNESEDPIQQLKEAYERFRSGDMTDEEKEEFLKKYGKYFKGSNTRSRSIDPEYMEPLQQSGRVIGRDNNGRVVREPSNNNGSTNNKTNNNNNTNNKDKKLTIAEVWAQSSSSARKTYIMYLYCKRKKEIVLQSEKMKNTTYYAWFN